MKYPIVAFSLVGIFFFTVPSIWQGSVEVDPVVALSFNAKDCTHEGEGLYCNFTDKATLRKWIETYPVVLEERLKELEFEAGRPSAILRKVCRDEGFVGDFCPSTLFGMAMTESRFGKAMVGDSGRSEGYFHILDIHKLTDDCKYDLECSASFSLRRMVRYGFKTNPDQAIRAHNGSPSNPLTLTYLLKVQNFAKGFSQLK